MKSVIDKLDDPKAVFYNLLANHMPSFMHKGFITLEGNRQFTHNWHIDAICDYLTAFESGECSNLIIMLPPRFLKSILSTILFTAWILGRNPQKKVVCASYSANLSKQMSEMCRQVMLSDWYKIIFPNCQIAQGSNRKDHFETHHTDNISARGGRLATSVGGTVTGFGGDYLILDDPMKPSEAHSETIRESVNRWVGGTFLNRSNDQKNAKIMCIMQRLHENDVAGFLQKSGNYEILKLPVYFEKKTQIITPKRFFDVDPGFLHEERFGQKEYDKLSRVMGEYAFAGQYLQNPAPIGGGIVKREWLLPIISRPPVWDAIYQSWDTASKANAGSDYSCGTCWGVFKNEYYLIDLVYGRYEFDELLTKVANFADQYNCEHLLIEDKASGIQLAQMLRKDGYNCISINPYKDKITRLSTVTPILAGGRVKFDVEKHWFKNLQEQLCIFPNGSHDDIVDSISQFLNHIKNKNFDNKYKNDTIMTIPPVMEW